MEKSVNIWRRINGFVGLLPIGAIFGVMFFLGHVEIKDLDLWLHLAMGKFISQHQYVPSVDMLSCSIAGTSWVNHEWLFQILIYNVFRAWGPDGLLHMQAVLVVATMFLLLLLGYNKEKQGTVGFLLLMVGLTYMQRFTIRPDLFSLFFFALYIWVLALHIDKKWALPVLFCAQVVWTNMHGFFFFGPLFIFLGLISEGVKRHLPLPYEWNDTGRLTDSEYARLKWIFFFSIAACFLNPQVAAGAAYPVRIFFSLIRGENKIFFDHIQELARPFRGGDIIVADRLIYYKLLIFLSAVSFVFNRRRIDISALFLWVVFLLFSLSAIRNMVFFCFAAYLVIITNVLNISYRDIIPFKFSDRRFLYVTLIFAKILFLLWILQYYREAAGQQYYDFDRYALKSEFKGIGVRSYPHRAVDFLVDNDVTGNFFNDFNSGAYLLGRTYPTIRVFIDGRTEVYGEAFFKQYLRVWDQGDKELFDELSQRFNMTGAFLNSVRQNIPRNIVRNLYEDPQWKVVYFDHDAVIFLKDIPQNKALIDTYVIDLKKWQPKKIDLFKMGPMPVRAYQNYCRAYTLESMGLYDAALGEAHAALEASTSYPEVYALVGKIYAQRKEYDLAFSAFRKAASMSLDDKTTRINLLRAYIDSEHYEDAAREAEAVVGKWPKDPQALFWLAKSYLLAKQYDKVVPAIRRAYAVAPHAYKDLGVLAQMLVDAGQNVHAREVYALLLVGKKDDAGLWFTQGELLKTLGDFDGARESFERAAKLQPDNSAIVNAVRDVVR